jgi:hypothetical protein
MNMRIARQVHIVTPARGLATLCGFLDDMTGPLTSAKVTCPECLEVLRFCRSYRFTTPPSPCAPGTDLTP